MVKLVFLCWRRAGIDHARYAELLLDGHVPLALRHHPALRRYVVNIVDASPPQWPALDSIGELSFDDLADFRERLYDSDAGRRIVEDDVAGFMGGAHAYVTSAHVQRAGATPPQRGTRSPGVKLVCPIIRRPDMTHDAFVTHWLERHVPLALAGHPGMTRYVTNVVTQRLSGDGPALDGIAELHFPSADALRDGPFASAEAERGIRDDVARFIGRAAAYRVSEYVER
jgi:uncharacterized protein (TIGR02118 family)